MDAFEQLVSEILWMEGYWARTSVKVELTKEEKREIGRHSARAVGTGHRCLSRSGQSAAGDRMQKLPRLARGEGDRL
jgi:hypothetical protein